MGSVMWWSVVLIGLLLAAFVAVAHVKKRMIGSEDVSGTGFSLGDLRALHREGKMSDEEFEKAKRVIVQSARLPAEKDQKPKAKTTAPPDEPPVE